MQKDGATKLKMCLKLIQFNLLEVDTKKSRQRRLDIIYVNGIIFP
jgi:hypothetical protein